jgi:hypothetical protein
LHEVRSVIEAFSKSATIQGAEHASACGLAFGNGEIGITVRVKNRTGWTTCKLDRWD